MESHVIPRQMTIPNSALDYTGSSRMQTLKAYPRRMMSTIRQVCRRLKSARSQGDHCGAVVETPIEKFLMGGEGGISASRWARMTTDPMRPSTRVTEGPHSLFLAQYKTVGRAILHPEVLRATPYYCNALNSIEFLGRYFEATSESQITSVAERYLDLFDGREVGKGVYRTEIGKPVLARKIAHSTCVEVIDGHHRVSMAAQKGASSIDAIVINDPVLTPIQSMLLDVLWENGRKELYQPVDVPEVHDSWTLVRSCRDRFKLMIDYLTSRNRCKSGLTYLDVASNYGWFVSQFRNFGFNSYGVERDPISIEIGEALYKNPRGVVIRSDAARFLERTEDRFDVVSCLSLLHHAILGRLSVTADDFLKLISSRTKSVMFIDMGEEHEEWFRTSLQGWNRTSIQKWIQDTTGFHVVALGTDNDSVGKFASNYGRTLFACERIS